MKCRTTKPIQHSREQMASTERQCDEILTQIQAVKAYIIAVARLDILRHPGEGRDPL